MRRVLIQPCSVRNCSLDRHRVQSLGLRLWARFTFFIPDCAQYLARNKAQILSMVSYICAQS